MAASHNPSADKPNAGPTNSVQALATREAQVWDGSRYYDDAEQWLFVFWRDTHPFVQLFRQLDIRNLLELACGHGRHSEYILQNQSEAVQTLVMMDILQSNVDHCQERIGQRDNVTILQNNGVNFQPVPDASLTALFCYDAMVHFHRDVVRSYLVDTARVLLPGGKALLHHSNFALDPDTSFGSNPSARAFMSAALFKKYAEAAGLEVVEQKVIAWGRQPDLDCLSLVQRPQPAA